MVNRITIGIIILIIIGIIPIGSCVWNASKKIDIQDINNCVSDSDCVLVVRGYCGGALAINKDYLDTWNKFLEEDRVEHQGVLCKPTLPLDYFKAECLNNKCVATQIKLQPPPIDYR
ncbi:hypothetical protein KY348_06180 [Candidatus Woesearchaeota archaeon]|nr:hypothetical protein [Candidatus Woesearchaeota archaeon]